MFASWKVGIMLTATNLTGPGFSGLIRSAEDANARVQQLQNSMQYLKLGAAFAFGEIGRLGVTAFMASADAASKYQLTMQLVSQQTNATVEQMKRLDSIVTDLSAGPNRTMFGMNTIGAMARELQQSGIDLSRIISPFSKSDNRTLLQEVVYAAEVEKLRTGVSGEASARSFGQIIKGYGLDKDPNRLSKFLNSYTAVASQTHMKATDLAVLETQFGQTGRTFNLTDDGMLKLYGFLRQRGFQSSTAATSLSNMLVNMMPTFSLNATKTSAKTQALTMAGLLTRGDPANAKKMLDLYMRQSAGIGLPVSANGMTVHQANALAQAVVVAVTTGKFGGHGKLTAEQVVNALSSAEIRFEDIFGQGVGHQIFASMMRQAVNLRGFRAAMAFADSPQAFKHYEQQISTQMSLDERAQQLRHQVAAMKEMVPQEINTILTKLGGYTFRQVYNPNTHKFETMADPIKGGPLDIVQRFMFKLTDTLGKIAAWATAHPEAAANIGKLIGVVGVGGLVTAAVLATGAVLNLTRSLFAFSGEGYGGSLGGLGRMFGRGRAAGVASEAAEAGETGLLARLFGARTPGALRDKSLFRLKMGGLNPWYREEIFGSVTDAARRGNSGRRSLGFGFNAFEDMGMRLRGGFGGSALKAGMLGEEGLGPALAAMREALPAVGRVLMFLPKVLFGVADIVGWIWLAWTAFDFLVKHAWDVGYWTGIMWNVVRTIAKVLWDGIVGAVRGIWSMVQGLINNITHPAQMVAGWGNFWADFRDGFLKATDPQKWQHDKDNEHKYLFIQNHRRNTALWKGLNVSPLTKNTRGQIIQLHDKRQMNVTLEVNGWNMVDPAVQKTFIDQVTGEVMHAVDKSSRMHTWSSAAAPPISDDAALPGFGMYAAGGKW